MSTKPPLGSVTSTDSGHSTQLDSHSNSSGEVPTGTSPPLTHRRHSMQPPGNFKYFNRGQLKVTLLVQAFFQFGFDYHLGDFFDFFLLLLLYYFGLIIIYHFWPFQFGSLGFTVVQQTSWYNLDFFCIQTCNIDLFLKYLGWVW